jgi:hypothetical protein
VAEAPKLGAKVRALRRREGLTQVQLAERLGISPSYLNLIEHNRRPLPAQHLIKLAQLFQIDLQAFSADDEDDLRAALMEAFGDPLFEAYELTQNEVKELAGQNPNAARAVLALYRGFRQLKQSGFEGSAVEQGASPPDEVGELLQRNQNYFPDIEDGAESLWRAARLSSGDLQARLVDYLESVHGFSVRFVRESALPGQVRRLDREHHALLLSEVLAPRSRLFQLAHVIGLLEQSDVFDRVVRDQTLTSDESRRLGRVALANYFAGAVLMPYQAMLESAQRERYDIELLGHRFRASFEQVCHRLTTLRRPGAEGIPLHLVRVDVAGNLSKKFSASGFRFSSFGAGCPRWNEHAAFLTPGIIRTQVSRMPDGTAYFSVARTVRTSRGGFREGYVLHSVGIGCELRYASRMVYSDGIDLASVEGVPIGVACRVCERSDCDQRAFPAVFRPLRIDEDVRGTSFYVEAQRARTRDLEGE